MKAILTGTIAGGFGISMVVPDEQAEDLVIRLLAGGELAEAIDVQDPKSLHKRCPRADPEGEFLVVFGQGIGNGFSMFGPFGDREVAETFGERERSEDEEWEVFENARKGVTDSATKTAGTRVSDPPVVVIEINGGAIYCARSTAPMRIVILDQDTEGSDGERIMEVNGESVYTHDYVLTDPAEAGRDGIDVVFVKDVVEQLRPAGMEPSTAVQGGLQA